MRGRGVGVKVCLVEGLDIGETGGVGVGGRRWRGVNRAGSR